MHIMFSTIYYIALNLTLCYIVFIGILILIINKLNKKKLYNVIIE